jgi:uncharacterized protein
MSFFMQMGYASPAFHLLGHEIEAGTSQSWVQPVSSTDMPMTVMHGQQPGPVLMLVAGVHGDEYPSVWALQTLTAQINPKQLHGTLIILQVANLEGFHARQRLTPNDAKNLNRVFPGRAEGTLTEQIAYFITHQLIAKTDFLIDIHSGSWTQTLLPHVYSPLVNQPTLDGVTLAFAKSLAIPHVVLYDERPTDPNNAISLPNTAQTRGKPSLTLEVGYGGWTKPEDVELILQSCLRAMQHLNMLQKTHVTVSEGQQHLYARLISVKSPVVGLFKANVQVGEQVKAGQVVGEISDYFGQPLTTLLAPVAGTVLMLNHTPPIRAGESVVEIAIPK